MDIKFKVHKTVCGIYIVSVTTPSGTFLERCVNLDEVEELTKEINENRYGKDNDYVQKFNKGNS